MSSIRVLNYIFVVVVKPKDNVMWRTHTCMLVARTQLVLSEVFMHAGLCQIDIMHPGLVLCYIYNATHTNFVLNGTSELPLIMLRMGY